MAVAPRQWPMTALLPLPYVGLSGPEPDMRSRYPAEASGLIGYPSPATDFIVQQHQLANLNRQLNRIIRPRERSLLAIPQQPACWDPASTGLAGTPDPARIIWIFMRGHHHRTGGSTDRSWVAGLIWYHNHAGDGQLSIHRDFLSHSRPGRVHASTSWLHGGWCIDYTQPDRYAWTSR